MNDLAIRETGAGVRIDVRVLPRSSSNQIAGLRDGRLLIRVTAPPVDGAANDAIVDLLGRRLKVPRRAISIVSGETSRQKTVEIAGARADSVRTLLSGRD